MDTAIRILASIALVGMAIAFCIATPNAHADGCYNSCAPERAPHAVSLLDASAPPAELTMLYPGASITYAFDRAGHNCKTDGRVGFFSDVQAYNWSGRALGPHEHKTLRDQWREPGTRRHVTFDGITFRNHTSSPVLVAGWCD